MPPGPGVASNAIRCFMDFPPLARTCQSAVCPQPLDDGPPVAKQTPRHRRDANGIETPRLPVAAFEALGRAAGNNLPVGRFFKPSRPDYKSGLRVRFLLPLALAAGPQARPAMRCDRWGACREGPRSSRIMMATTGGRLPGVVLIVVRHLRHRLSIRESRGDAGLAGLQILRM